jgi:hypothetical protein
MQATFMLMNFSGPLVFNEFTCIDFFPKLGLPSKIFGNENTALRATGCECVFEAPVFNNSKKLCKAGKANINNQPNFDLYLTPKFPIAGFFIGTTLDWNGWNELEVRWNFHDTIASKQLTYSFGLSAAALFASPGNDGNFLRFNSNCTVEREAGNNGDAKPGTGNLALSIRLNANFPPLEGYDLLQEIINGTFGEKMCREVGQQNGYISRFVWTFPMLKINPDN